MISYKAHKLLGATLIALFMTSCENPLEVENRARADEQIEAFLRGNKMKFSKENGVYHVATYPTYGYEVNHGDTVSFWFTGYTFGSKKVIFSTNIKAVAINAQLDTNQHSLKPLTTVHGQDNLIAGLHNGLLMCRQGQKSSIYFNPSFAFGNQQTGTIPPWSSLVFDVEIIHVNSPAIIAEKAAIAAMNLSGYTLHSSGLYYKFGNDTIGALPEAVDTVYAWYKCSLPNGTEVEQSATPNTQIILSDKITPALKEGIMLLNAGRKGNYIAPSPMGYGKKGATNVSPYQTLLYEIRLDSIK